MKVYFQFLIGLVLLISSQAWSSRNNKFSDENDDTLSTTSSIGSIRIVDLPQIPKVKFNLRETPKKMCDLFLVKRALTSSLIGGEVSTNLPETYTLQLEPTIKNQKLLGTCATFATIECLEYVYGKQFLFSQPSLITTTEKLEDNCENDGLSIGQVMKTALEIGAIQSYFWPYDGYHEKILTDNKGILKESTNICIIPPFNEAQSSGLVKYSFQKVELLFRRSREESIKGTALTNEGIIKSGILNKSPVAVSIPIVEGWGWDSGTVSVGSKTLLTGWHAITIYGYDDKGKFFNFKNSWGTTWGKQGCGTISYGYIRYASEAWIASGKKIWTSYKDKSFYVDL